MLSSNCSSAICSPVPFTNNERISFPFSSIFPFSRIFAARSRVMDFVTPSSRSPGIGSLVIQGNDCMSMGASAPVVVSPRCTSLFQAAAIALASAVWPDPKSWPNATRPMMSKLYAYQQDGNKNESINANCYRHTCKPRCKERC